MFSNYPIIKKAHLLLVRTLRKVGVEHENKENRSRLHYVIRYHKVPVGTDNIKKISGARQAATR
jgi:hypothetical protein